MIDADTVWVIEHGSDPRPAIPTASQPRVLAGRNCKELVTLIEVEFTDERGGRGWRFASSVHPTRAAAVKAEKELETK